MAGTHPHEAAAVAAIAAPVLTRHQYAVLGVFGDRLAELKAELAEVIGNMQEHMPESVSGELYDDYMQMTIAVNRAVGRVLKLQLNTTHALGGVRRVDA